MERLYHFIVQQLWTSTDVETTQLLFTKKPYKKRTINLFIFVFFIVAIPIYATLNLLLMAVVILLFIYWIVQVQVLSVQRQLKHPSTRSSLYFNRVQKMLQRRQYKEALSVYQKYTMRHEDEDNVQLYVITLFLNRLWAEFITEYQKDNSKNQDIVMLYKYCLLQTHQFNVLQTMLDDSELDYIMLQWMLEQEVDLEQVHDNQLKQIIQDTTRRTL